EPHATSASVAITHLIITATLHEIGDRFLLGWVPNDRAGPEKRPAEDRARSTMTTAQGEAPVTGAAYTSFLAQLPFFVGGPPEAVALFAHIVVVRHLPAGTDIVVQRQYGHAMFVLMAGAVVVHAIGPDDVSVTLGRLARSGDFFGEAALLGRGERTATVTAE